MLTALVVDNSCTGRGSARPLVNRGICMNPLTPAFDTLERVRSIERTMITVRWFGVAFALVQALTYYLPYPPGVRTVALGVVAALVTGNVSIQLAHRRWTGMVAACRISAVGMALDFTIVMTFVAVYTFDVNTAIFALMYLLPLQAAVRYGRRGALAMMGAATIAYILREVWGSLHFGFDFLPTSISYRMGIGFIVAAVAGSMAARYEREHARVQKLYQTEHAAAEALRAAGELRNTFLAAVSHELRTPLTSILGLSITIEDRMNARNTFDQTDAEMVRHVVQEAHRLDALLCDLLDLERLARGLGHGDFHPVDVAELVRAVSQRMGIAQRRALELRLELLEPLPVDAPKLERIVENLLANALKYTPDGTAIHVRASDWREGVLIRIEDEGAGVPRQLREAIFEPFSRGEASLSHAPGTGIGLSLVRRFSELHGGSAWVEERVGGGASFCVFLPRTRAVA